MFNLFNSKSLFHEKESSISWRQLLEEVGMPLSASVFVFVQSLTGDASQNQVLLRSFALFFFVFFLFLFAGKLLLSNLTVLKTDSAIWFDNLRLQKDKINKTQEWENEITRLKIEIDEQRVEKWKIVDILKSPEAELKRLNERREMLVKLFESEFNLARSYREKLTGKQIEDILK
jgi:Na+/melibiose symporter-like transporter